MLNFDDRPEYDFDAKYDSHEYRDLITRIIVIAGAIVFCVIVGFKIHTYFYGDYVAVITEYKRMWSSKSPDDIVVTVPSAKNVGKRLLAGRWEGKWSGNADALLIVEKIGTNKVQLYYQWNGKDEFNQRVGGNELVAGYKEEKGICRIEWYIDNTKYRRGVFQKYSFTLDKKTKTLHGTVTDLRSNAVAGTVYMKKASREF